MADPTAELMLEVLKDVQGQLAQVRRKQDEHSAEFLIVRTQLASLIGDGVLTATRLAEHETRLERIERRLDITD